MSKSNKPEGFGEAALSPMFKHGEALRWRRLAGELDTNVKWIVRHHSPTGFEVGYSGSGPADLALNAMAALFPFQGDRGAGSVKCFDGAVSREAWFLHQEFKFEFLADADRDAGQIEWSAIEAWLRASDNVWILEGEEYA